MDSEFHDGILWDSYNESLKKVKASEVYAFSSDGQIIW